MTYVPRVRACMVCGTPFVVPKDKRGQRVCGASCKAKHVQKQKEQLYAKRNAER